MRVNTAVNDAIKKGRLTVNLPGALIFLIILFGIPSLLLQYTEKNWIIIVCLAVSAVVGFALGWIYSGFAVVRWKIWAFENVKNVHELKEKAIKENIIYKDGHWSEKLNFANYEQRQKLKMLERRFLSKDQHHDDLHVSKETAVYISKKSTYLFMGIGISLSGVAVYRYTIQFYSNALPLGILGLFFLIVGFYDYRKIEPQVLISSLGIKFYKKELMLWESITNEKIEIIRYHERHNKYLRFEYKSKQEQLLINNLAINTNEMEHLLQVYRLRHEKNNSN